MKKTLVLSLSLLASVALAATLVIGSTGKGCMATSDGRTGSFDYEVSKRTAANGVVTLPGRFRFEQQPNAHGPYVLIVLSKLETLGKNGAVCEFSGHAVLTTPVNGVSTSFGGTVSVRVQDRRNGTTGVGDADTFRVRFVGERGLTFASEGLLNAGDLTVFSRTQ